MKRMTEYPNPCIHMEMTAMDSSVKLRYIQHTAVTLTPCVPEVQLPRSVNTQKYIVVL